MPSIPGVFVIDQDADVRYQVQRLVERAEFSFSGQAGLGTEAVVLAREAKPDILLCGVREPLTRTIQTLESLAHVLPETPVVVYSEAHDLETIRRVMLAGARDFIKAPFKADELRRSLIATMESEERRRLRDAGNGLLGPEAVVLTIFGAKGGVGKTTVATNLAVAFARAGQTTVLLDADDTFGDAGPSLAMAPDYPITDMLRELDGSGGDVPSKPLAHHASGLALAAGPTNPFAWKGIPGERLQRLVEQLARRYDVVVVDTGSSLSDVTLAAIQAASLVLWVTTPDYASVRDSLQALQAIRGVKPADDRVRLVLNAVSPDLEVRPSSVEEALGMKIFWTIPYDRLLRQSTQLGKAAVESETRSPAAKNLVDLAQVLMGGPLEVPENTTEGRRLLGSIRDKMSRKAGGGRKE